MISSKIFPIDVHAKRKNHLKKMIDGYQQKEMSASYVLKGFNYGVSV
jgi:hypothetical protein